MPNNKEHLRQHVETSHPKILSRASEESSDDNVDSDFGVTNNPENTITEMIYLEEEDKKPAKIAIKRKHNKSVPQAPVETETELDIFIKYISCLMKQLPNDVCSQVQLDIVNLIMTAKIKSQPAKKSLNLVATEMNYILELNHDDLGPRAGENKQ